MQEQSFAHCQSLVTNVRLATLDPAVDAPYGLLDDHLLGISGGRIAALQPVATADLSAFGGEIIDGRGGWLTPGLIDCHTHLV
jgi:imidazolonepropionase